MEEVGFKEEEDFEIQQTSTTPKKDKRTTYIQIVFKSKGNKKTIEHLTSLGWGIDRRYYNDDGNPSIFCSDIHGKVIVHSVQMIVLKQRIDYTDYINL